MDVFESPTIELIRAIVAIRRVLQPEFVMCGVAA